MQLPNGVAKARSRKLTRLVDSFCGCHDALVGTLQRCSMVETAADGKHLVATAKAMPRQAPLLGKDPGAWLPCMCFQGPGILQQRS